MIGKKIAQVKGTMSYEEMSDDIYNKTGHRLHWTTLQKYVTGTRNPTIKMLEILSDYSKRPISFFVQDEESELFAKVARLDKLRLIKETYEKTMDVVHIPLLGAVPAGDPNLQEENIEDIIPVPKCVYNKETFALRIKGDSMIGVGIDDGDIVYVKKQPKAEIGQTIIARIGDEVTCKRYYVKNGRPVLEPANGKYARIEPAQLEIVGVVTRVCKKIN